MIDDLRKRIPHEEFDYQTLLDSLRTYSRPRDKITDLLKKGSIVRIKKGLYIFGDEYRKNPYSKEILANLIYGPSYISLDYALGYHGLIPERVEAVTSVTTGRSREFLTPAGLFIYRMIPKNAFRIGMDRTEIGDGRGFLIAVPEKALADKLYKDRGIGIQTQQALLDYLENQLRFDISELHKMDHDYLSRIAGQYRSGKIRLLSNLTRRLKAKG